MNKYFSNKIAIGTTTFYRPNNEIDVRRADLAKEVIRRSNQFGYDIYVVDGGSPDELLTQFDKEGAIVYLDEKLTMGQSRRKALELAKNSQKEVIVWMEPEKDSFISEIHKTAKPIIDDIADLVVPNRGELTTYPTAQQYAEPLGNLFWQQLTEYKLDMWSGPRIMNPKASEYFISYDGKYGDRWESIFIPVIDAIKNGSRVLSIDVDYTHPRFQTQLEEHNEQMTMKRLDQLYSLCKAIEIYWRTI